MDAYLLRSSGGTTHNKRVSGQERDCLNTIRITGIRGIARILSPEDAVSGAASHSLNTASTILQGAVHVMCC